MAAKKSIREFMIRSVGVKYREADHAGVTTGLAAMYIPSNMVKIIPRIIPSMARMITWNP
jgi:hypothetical protein